MTSTISVSTTLNHPSRDTLSNSQLLSSSISSLSSPTTRQSASQISKIYRQSSTLFLTRRLPESLSTILPVITPQVPNETNPDSEPAPISRASRTTRIKVWSLYLTILNAVVELDPDEGKQAFGSSEWRSLVSKVREGEVWEEVVQNGYGGVEGDVDSDVVINLATLLLAHARSQKINQTRLENYLATSSNPTLDISNHLIASSKHRRTASPSKGGTDTPRDLNARVKILELYTLHVLLRNNEWDYAREFISISSVLDEERREAFLQALQSLQDEQHEAEAREREEKRYQEEQLQKDLEEARRRRAESDERERRRVEEEKEREHRREKLGSRGSEIDYGVEDARPGSSSKRSTKASSLKGGKTPTTSPKSKSSAPISRKAPAGVLERAGTILVNLRKLIEGHMSTRPMFLMQLLAFIVGLLIVISRRDVKERVKRLMAQGWGKVRQTAGMGAKVSYI